MRPEEKRQEVIVGVVVLIILVATVMGIMWGNKADIFSSRSYYTVRVARASGLEEGDPVTVSGVPKGVVDDFIVREDSVDIIIGVDKDITNQKHADELIRAREEDLEHRTYELEEMNTALKVLLKHRDEDRKSMEEKIVSNLKEMVFPFLDKLKDEVHFL